jgi:hypothetical protein
VLVLDAVVVCGLGNQVGPMHKATITFPFSPVLPEILSMSAGPATYCCRLLVRPKERIVRRRVGEGHNPRKSPSCKVVHNEEKAKWY